MKSMQRTLNTFGALTRKLGLILNENKTKFQCRAKGNKTLAINGSEIGRIHSYKYLSMYVGYTAEAREAEVNFLSAQCKARMQSLRPLAWSSQGVGVPVLRMIYVSTARSIIEYASPVLFCLNEGMLEKSERIQNEAMQIILKCPKSTIIDAMFIEVGLPRIRDRIDTINIVAAI